MVYRFIEEANINNIHLYYLMHPLLPEKTLERDECRMKEHESKDGRRWTLFAYKDFMDSCGLGESEIPVNDRSWVRIGKSYYGDANRDGYLDVFISFLVAGQHSAPPDLYNVILTSKVVGEIEVLN